MNKYPLRLFLMLFLGLAGPAAEACTRIVYQTGDAAYIVGRTMDWTEDPGTDLWAFPRGMKRNGWAGSGAVS